MKNNDRFWELATAKLHGEISADEVAEFDLLLKNESNKLLYQEIASLKNDVSGVGHISGVSMYRSWESVTRKIGPRKIHKFRDILKYAAILVIAFLLGVLFTNQFNKPNIAKQFTEVVVPLGQMSEITLFDGTKVWLNSGTTLRYNNRFGLEERNIELQGEAFFKVTKDKIPFKVKLKNTEVEVLGTSFNAVSYSDEDYSQVTLVEGKVSINNQSGSKIAELKPSEQIYIDDILKKATLNKVETGFYTSWTEGKIVFDNEQLSEISKRLERWYNVDIQFKDAEIGNLYFSGTILKSKPFNQIITAFELLLPIKINYTTIPNGKDLIVFSKK